VVDCLSFHAGYRCRHSGVCCRTGWDLPFEPADRAVAERLRLVPSGAFRDGDGVSFAERRADGSCVFLDSGDGEVHLCSIHRAAGHDVLPVTCRMFPRVFLTDARGTRLSLSHYCPSAADRLFADTAATAIVEAPAALTNVGPPDGLDATEALPPLLREGVLMDLESFSEWERLAVETLTMEGFPPLAAVERLESATRRIAAWSPGAVPLLDAVREGFALEARRAPSRIGPAAPFDRTATNRWLAAHLFGNWIAYQGRGLLTIVRYVRACLDVLTVEFARDGNLREAIRRSDYLIIHESDSQQLARAIDLLLRRRAALEG
jgi:Fe-S-cluster containining protein